MHGAQLHPLGGGVDGGDVVLQVGNRCVCVCVCGGHRGVMGCSHRPMDIKGTGTNAGNGVFALQDLPGKNFTLINYRGYAKVMTAEEWERQWDSRRYHNFNVQKWDKVMEVDGLLYDQYTDNAHNTRIDGEKHTARSTTIAGMFNDARGLPGVKNNLHCDPDTGMPTAAPHAISEC